MDVIKTSPVDSTPGWIFINPNKGDVKSVIERYKTQNVQIWRPATNQSTGESLLDDKGLFQCMVPITDSDHKYDAGPYFVKDTKSPVSDASVVPDTVVPGTVVPGSGTVSNASDVPNVSNASNAPVPVSNVSDVPNAPAPVSGNYGTHEILKDIATVLGADYVKDGIKKGIKDMDKIANDAAAMKLPRPEFYNKVAEALEFKVGQRVVKPRDLNTAKGRLANAYNKFLEDTAAAATAMVLPKTSNENRTNDPINNKDHNAEKDKQLVEKMQSEVSAARDARDATNVPNSPTPTAKDKISQRFNNLKERVTNVFKPKVPAPAAPLSPEREAKNQTIQNIIEHAKSEGILNRPVPATSDLRLLNEKNTDMRPAMTADNSKELVPKKMINRDAGTFRGEPVLKIVKGQNEPFYVGTLLKFVDDQYGTRTWSFLKDGRENIETTRFDKTTKTYDQNSPLYFAVINTGNVLDESIAVKGGKSRRFVKRARRHTRKGNKRVTRRFAKRRANRRTRRR